MQGCQNLGDDRLHLRMKRLMHPESCGYRYETGGLMERLRELSVEKSKDAFFFLKKNDRLLTLDSS